MSGALWFFFWGWGGGAPPVPSPAPAPPQDPGSGGGRKKRQKPPYIPAQSDFWETREKYLRAIQAETAPEIPQPAPRPISGEAPTPPQPVPNYFNYTLLPRYTAERSVLISSLRESKNLEDLRARGARLIELNLAIAHARRLQLDYDREIRHQSRLKQLKKARRQVAALMSAQLLLKILYGNQPPP